MQLRPYQIDLQNRARAALQRHRSVVCVSPTGSGKTVTFCDILRQCHDASRSAYVVVHRDELVRQVSSTLDRFRVPHGYVTAKRTMSLIHPVQVCSVATLANRLNVVREPSLIVMDEAHHVVAGSWMKIMHAYRSSKVIGFTATPERLDGKPLGDVFSELIQGPTVKELIQSGSLVKPIYHVVPSTLTGQNIPVGISSRKLEAMTDAAKGLDGRSIYGDAVEHYTSRTPGMPAIVFAVSIRHADRIAESFRSVGWRFVTLHGGLSDADRVERVNGLSSGRYHGLVTVDLVSEGFDIPTCSVAIMLRKTASLSLYLQQGGRALRPAAGKTVAHIFDHVGNVHEHGLLEQDREWDLGRAIDRVAERENVKGVQSRQCPECLVAHEPAPVCPNCGHAYTAKDRDVRIVAGELIELDTSTDQPVSGKWRKCGCGYIHRSDKACGRCGHDQRKVEKRERNKEEAECNTLSELIELGRQRGYKNPYFWAQQRWRTSRKFASKREAAV
jgi:DNA repair protein RadD